MALPSPKNNPMMTEPKLNPPSVLVVNCVSTSIATSPSSASSHNLWDRVFSEEERTNLVRLCTKSAI